MSKKNAQQIIGGGGDYLFPVKKNQGNLYRQIDRLFKLSLELDDLIPPIDAFQSTDHLHGRIEERTCLVIPRLQLITCAEEWPGLKSVIMVTRERTINGKTSHSIAYFISSLEYSAEPFARYIRQHWAIENQLHWSLDCAFREDQSRMGDRTAANNLAAFRRLAVSMLKQPEAGKESIPTKMVQMMVDEKQLELLLKIDFSDCKTTEF